MRKNGNTDPANKILEEALECYIETMNDVRDVYKIIPDLHTDDRTPRQAMLLPALAGVGVGYIAKLI